VSATTTTLDPRCVAAGEALAAGDETAMRAHAAECGACAFLVPLVPDLRMLGTMGLGSAFEAVLNHAIEAGAPLLSRYFVERIVARGGQGVVCRATDRDLGVVAIKLLWCNPAAPVIADGRALKVLHLGVCRVYNIERHGDIRMVVMEFIEGKNLEERYRDFSVRQRLDMFREICGAVSAIHDAGLLHLDIKPRNILLRAGDRPVVADFGLAAEVDDAGRAVPVGCTPEYASPEQKRLAPVGRPADVYSLGKLLEQIVPDAPPSIRRVVARATQEREHDRYRDVPSMVVDLDRPARARKRFTRVATAAIALTLGASGTVLGVRRLTDARQRERGALPTIAGVWSGWHMCRGSRVGTSVALNVDDTGRITGIREFYPTPDDKQRASGSFQVTGTYEPATRTVSLVAGEWISAPRGYLKCDLTGTISATGTILEGESPTCTGCGPFQLIHR
jgi:hypothetical protein